MIPRDEFIIWVYCLVTDYLNLLSKGKRLRRRGFLPSFRSNMKDERDPDFVNGLKSARRLVETVIGQLSERFNIEKVRARDLWHLTSRMARKILSHTVAEFLNRLLGSNSLQFDGLVNQ